MRALKQEGSHPQVKSPHANISGGRSQEVQLCKWGNFPIRMEPEWRGRECSSLEGVGPLV